MNPTPAIPIAVFLAFCIVPIWAFWWSTSPRHAVVVSLIGTPVLAFFCTELILAAVLTSFGVNIENAVRDVATYGVIMGIISAALSLPIGLIASLLARAISVWQFPHGKVRYHSESLISMSRRLGGVMTLIKALIILASTTILFTVIGAGIGFCIGSFSPEYYRHGFGHSRRFLLIEERPPIEGIDTAIFGIGLGAGQGAGGGAVVGVILVMIFAWYNLRLAVLKAQKDVDHQESEQDLHR